jgi:N-acetyl-gamma-glutamyl-phosphate reductase
MIEVGIVGGAGYTGAELIRLLASHGGVRLLAVCSGSQAGRPVEELFPHLRPLGGLKFSDPDRAPLERCDAVFFATPNGVAMERAPALLGRGVRVVDLSADFRLRDAALWRQWYGGEHRCPELLSEAVYGLPELNRAAIRHTGLLANPGCYPTAVQLGFLPLLAAGAVDTGSLIADAKSGVSGAGRTPAQHTLLCEAADSLSAYGVAGHRHLPEILQGLSQVAAGLDLVFVPHLTPMIRGIHATLYARLSGSEADLQELFEEHYRDEPFVDVMPAGSHPGTRSVRGSNYCRIAVHRPPGAGRVVVLSVIDNLVKGAAGQAVQNFNIMFGLPEDQGLRGRALAP